MNPPILSNKFWQRWQIAIMFNLPKIGLKSILRTFKKWCCQHVWLKHKPKRAFMAPDDNVNLYTGSCSYNYQGTTSQHFSRVLLTSSEINVTLNCYISLGPYMMLSTLTHNFWHVHVHTTNTEIKYSDFSYKQVLLILHWSPPTTTRFLKMGRVPWCLLSMTIVPHCVLHNFIESGDKWEGAKQKILLTRNYTYLKNLGVTKYPRWLMQG